MNRTKILWIGRQIGVSLLAILAFSLVSPAASASPPAGESDNPNDYVQVRAGKFVLAGKPFVIRGTNYFGSWRYHHTIDVGGGIENFTIWAFYHDWDAGKLDLDFQFMRSQLNATAVRIGTPTQDAFASLVQFHQYAPWFDADGKIAGQYRDELVKMADLAYANGIRIQFCLLWNLKNEMTKDLDSFKSGGAMDRLYSTQVTSIATALRNNPGVLGYSIGNEVLVNYPINGTHPSSFEGIAEGFILRRLKDVRAAAPHQLLTIDEGANGERQWYAPELALIPVSDVDAGDGPKSIRLADRVDYLGTHFYPEKFQIGDLSDGFASKIADARRKIASYMQIAQGIGKPVVLSEFGLQVMPETLDPDQYSSVRDRFFEAILADAQKLGLQGMLAWDAIPDLALIPGQYVLKDTTQNKFVPVEVDINAPNDAPRRVLLYRPVFTLFAWRKDSPVPVPTAAARALASAWSDVPLPGIPVPRP